MYKAGKCPPGISGKKKVNDKVCEHHHPKRCNRFCKFGPYSRFGCNKRKDCKFFHPVLCKYSVKHGECLDPACTYTHLKGTRRFRQSDQSEQIGNYKNNRPWNQQLNPSNANTAFQHNQDEGKFRSPNPHPSYFQNTHKGHDSNQSSIRNLHNPHNVSFLIQSFTQSMNQMREEMKLMKNQMLSQHQIPMDMVPQGNWNMNQQRQEDQSHLQEFQPRHP